MGVCSTLIYKQCRSLGVPASVTSVTVKRGSPLALIAATGLASFSSLSPYCGRGLQVTTRQGSIYECTIFQGSAGKTDNCNA